MDRTKSSENSSLLLSWCEFSFRLISRGYATCTLCCCCWYCFQQGRSSPCSKIQKSEILAQKFNVTFFLNCFERSGTKGASKVKKSFQKALILAFGVIMQPHSCTIFPFLEHCVQCFSKMKFSFKLTQIFIPKTRRSIYQESDG